MGRYSDEDLEERRRRMLVDVYRQTDAVREGLERLEGARRSPSGSALRLRMLILPALAILLVLHFVGRGGEPLGIRAAFTPGEGTSFAGPSVFGGDGSTVTVAPGDIVGATEGEGSVLSLGRGKLALEPGARAVVESLLPPRARLLGGSAIAEGSLRVVTAHGVLDLDDGRCRVRIDRHGLTATLESGAATLVNVLGTVELVPGQAHTTY